MNLMPNQKRYYIVCASCEHQYLEDLKTSSDFITISKCSKCNRQSEYWITTIRSKQSKGSRKEGIRDYSVRTIDFNGSENLIEFRDFSYDDFSLKSKDRVIFAYRNGDLKLIQNLSIKNYLKLEKPPIANVKWKWLAGVIAIILGMTHLGKFEVSGVPFILIGLFLIPPTLNFIEKRLDFTFSSLQKWAIVLGGLFIAITILPNDEPIIQDKEEIVIPDSTQIKQD